MTVTSRALAIAGLCALFGGCGPGATDGGSDSGTIPEDAGLRDAGPASGGDAGTDGGADNGADAGLDAGPDGGPADAGVDAGFDAGPDAGNDAGFDAGAAPVALPLLGCPQEGYTAGFTIGGQPFQLVVDTGSAELAVASTGCTNCTGVSPLYAPGAGAIDQNATASVSYVSGTGWSGEIYQDTVGLQGFATSVPVDFVAIDSQSGGFFDFEGCSFGDVPFLTEGIAGFGPAALAESGTEEVVAAFAQGGVPPTFAVALCSMGGSLWLGGYDPASVTAPPVYTPLVAADYYEVTLDDLQVSGASLGFGASDFGPVVVDTDTTEFELPSDAYNALTTAIAAAPLFAQSFGDASWFSGDECSVPLQNPPPTPAELDAALPSVTLEFAGADGGEVAVVLGPTESYLDPVVSDGVTYYCPEIEARDFGGSTVLGSAAMRGLVVIFDTTGQIGFAPQSSCP
jgi:hypothetical protein